MMTTMPTHIHKGILIKNININNTVLNAIHTVTYFLMYVLKNMLSPGINSDMVPCVLSGFVSGIVSVESLII